MNRFKEYLSGKYSSNTVRLTLASCSSFYTYLESEEYITRSPFANIKYPRRFYKKAVKTDQGSPVPVMNQGEHRVIMETTRQKARVAGKRASVINSRPGSPFCVEARHEGTSSNMDISNVNLSEVLVSRRRNAQSENSPDG